MELYLDVPDVGFDLHLGAVPKKPSADTSASSSSSTSPSFNPNRNYSTPADKPKPTYDYFERGVCNPKSYDYDEVACKNMQASTVVGEKEQTGTSDITAEQNKPKFFRDFTLIFGQTMGFVGDDAKNAERTIELREDITWEEFLTRTSKKYQKDYCEKFPNSQNAKRLKSYKAGVWTTLGGVTLLTVGGIVYAVRKPRNNDEKSGLKGYSSKTVVYGVPDAESAKEQTYSLKGYEPKQTKKQPLGNTSEESNDMYVIGSIGLVSVLAIGLGIAAFSGGKKDAPTYVPKTDDKPATKQIQTTANIDFAPYLSELPENVRIVQTYLNNQFGSGLVVDGVLGPLTKESLQKRGMDFRTALDNAKR